MEGSTPLIKLDRYEMVHVSFGNVAGLYARFRRATVTPDPPGMITLAAPAIVIELI
jgi:hypothetical protein